MLTATRETLSKSRSERNVEIKRIDLEKAQLASANAESAQRVAVGSVEHLVSACGGDGNLLQALWNAAREVPHEQAKKSRVQSRFGEQPFEIRTDMAGTA